MNAATSLKPRKSARTPGVLIFADPHATDAADVSIFNFNNYI
jgi:hypothetical protein